MSIKGVKSEGGFSIIEVLVAIFIITTSLIALMKAGIIVFRNTVKNEVRYKAIEALRNNINLLVSSPSFDNITTTEQNCSLKVRSFSVDNCTITDNVTLAMGLENTKKIVGTIRWRFMGNGYSYTIQTFVTKQ